MKTLTIYTDGASRGNPGPGGWASVLMDDTEAVELAGRKEPATNNQMELEAAIQGLTYALKNFNLSAQVGGYKVELHSDSAYVLNGIKSWLDGWVQKGWVTMAKKPVENKDQWMKLMMLRDELGKNLHLVKVAGHSGHEFNDRCDELAVAVALNEKPRLFKGTLKAYKVQLLENPPKSAPKKKSSSKDKPSGPAYSYVSFVNGKVYADKTWKECEARVKGAKGAKYQKVFSKAEETSLVQDYTLKTLL